MRLKLARFLLCPFILTFFSCNSNSDETTKDRDTPDTSIRKLNTNTETALKVGGVYSMKGDSTYSISKILVIDRDAVHVRMYSNQFTSKPIKIDSDTLTILIGHAPMDILGFKLSNPELINVEKVKRFGT